MRRCKETREKRRKMTRTIRNDKGGEMKQNRTRRIMENKKREVRRCKGRREKRRKVTRTIRKDKGGEMK